MVSSRKSKLRRESVAYYELMNSKKIRQISEFRGFQLSNMMLSNKRNRSKPSLIVQQQQQQQKGKGNRDWIVHIYERVSPLHTRTHARLYAPTVSACLSVCLPGLNLGVRLFSRSHSQLCKPQRASFCFTVPCFLEVLSLSPTCKKVLLS